MWVCCGHTNHWRHMANIENETKFHPMGSVHPPYTWLFPTTIKKVDNSRNSSFTFLRCCGSGNELQRQVQYFVSFLFCQFVSPLFPGKELDLLLFRTKKIKKLRRGRIAPFSFLEPTIYSRKSSRIFLSLAMISCKRRRQKKVDCRAEKMHPEEEMPFFRERKRLSTKLCGFKKVLK